MGSPLELPVPVGNSFAVIPCPMSEDDFVLLIETLHLWKRKLVPGSAPVRPPIETAIPADDIYRCGHCSKPSGECRCDTQKVGASQPVNAPVEHWEPGPIKRGGLIAEVRAIMPTLPDTFTLDDAQKLVPNMPRIKLRGVLAAMCHGDELKTEQTGVRGRFGRGATYRKPNTATGIEQPLSAAEARLQDLRGKRAQLQTIFDELDSASPNREDLRQRIAEFDEMILKWEQKASAEAQTQAAAI